jgi:hypothetical protein
MAVKIANRDARQHVQRLHPFEGNNLYGHYFCVNPSSVLMGDSGYVVHSYGPHWPLFIAMTLEPYGPTVWFENKERHSVTTSKHRSQSHPLPPQGTTLLSKDQMVLLYRKGYKAIARDRVLSAQPYPADHIQTEFHREVA